MNRTIKLTENILLDLLAILRRWENTESTAPNTDAVKAVLDASNKLKEIGY